MVPLQAVSLVRDTDEVPAHEAKLPQFCRAGPRGFQSNSGSIEFRLTLSNGLLFGQSMTAQP